MKWDRLFEIVLKEKRDLKGAEGPVMEFEIVPSDYLSSLPLHKKIETLQKSLEEKKEFKTLLDAAEAHLKPLIQMAMGMRKDEIMV